MVQRRVFFAALLVLLSWVFPVSASAAGRAQGVVVERVGKGSAAEKAGIREGDFLLSWERLPNPPANAKGAKGVFSSPFDVSEAENEEGPRGTVVLGLEREGSPLAVTIRPVSWEIEVRPVMPEGTEKKYEEGAVLATSKNYKEAVLLWEEIARKSRFEDMILYCWICSRIAEAFSLARDPESAAKYYDESIGAAKRVKDNRIVIQLLVSKAWAYHKNEDPGKALPVNEEALALSSRPLITARILNFIYMNHSALSDLDTAGKCLERSLAIRQAEAPDSYAVAETLGNLGINSHYGGDYDSAEKYYLKSLALREKLTPESSALAMALNNLGVLEFRLGNLGKAEEYHTRALQIRERILPQSLTLAATYNNLGIVHHQRGDLKKGEEYYSKSLEIKEDLAPKSVDTAITLNNVGLASYDRGDLEKAEMYFKKALDLYESINYRSVQKTYPLNNLALLNLQRGDPAAAEDYYNQALEIRKAAAPRSLEVATITHNLALVAQRRGDLGQAEKRFAEALAIKHSLVPDSIDEAKTLEEFASLYEETGDFRKAEELFRQALVITGRDAPKGANHSAVLVNLGDLCHSQGRHSEAEELLKKSLDISRAMGRGNSRESYASYLLGSISLTANDPAGALGYYSDAVESVELMQGKLGGGKEAQEKFSAKYADYYRDLVSMQVTMKMEKEAFHTLERFRARTLLDMLAERDLVFSKDISEELINEQKRINHEYEKARSGIEKLDAEADREKFGELNGEITKLKEKQRDIEARIRKASPRLAMLQYPEALKMEQAASLLDRGCLFLSYSVGVEKTVLFALSAGGLEVFEIPAGRKDISMRTAYFRALVADPGRDAGELSSKARELYKLILGPAEKMIRRSDMIVVCPDGPLHYLPFCALKPKGNRYLAQRVPVLSVASATVLNEIRKERRSTKYGFRVVAFGDPDYSGPEVPPLPRTRREVEEIAGLFTGEAGAFLGPDATEENVEKNIARARYLHFACHGKLDGKFPLDSALILSPPAESAGTRRNGRLQAWEIFEGTRIDADLVTLSACETGLGREMGGEGLIGLTRAFQYAGAATVLSSLWSVSDESTAILMKTFYFNLKEGKTKAVALRLAQNEMIRSKYGHPFYWAGFTLNGDWK